MLPLVLLANCKNRCEVLVGVFIRAAAEVVLETNPAEVVTGAANVAAPVALVKVNAVPALPVPRVRLEAAGEVRDAALSVVNAPVDGLEAPIAVFVMPTAE
jgi:hypothetical protein